MKPFLKALWYMYKEKLYLHSTDIVVRICALYCKCCGLALLVPIVCLNTKTSIVIINIIIINNSIGFKENSKLYSLCS